MTADASRRAIARLLADRDGRGRSAALLALGIVLLLAGGRLAAAPGLAAVSTWRRCRPTCVALRPDGVPLAGPHRATIATPLAARRAASTWGFARAGERAHGARLAWPSSS